MKEFRTAYGPKPRVSVEFPEMGRTRQEFKKDCDINRILGQFRKTGTIAHLAKYQGQYGEFTEMDFTEAMLFIKDTEEMFYSIPANIRAKFDNDPAKFVDFATDENNIAQMREWGLAPAQRVSERVTPDSRPPETAGEAEPAQ